MRYKDAIKNSRIIVSTSAMCKHLFSFPILRLIIGLIFLFITLRNLEVFILPYPFFSWKFWIIIMLLTTGSTLLIQFFWALNNGYYLDMIYTDLEYWVRKNNIGSATLLLKSLTVNENMQKYFKEKYEEVHSNHTEKNKRFRISSRHGFLVNTIPELVDQIDNATVESLVFLKKYMKFEPSDTPFRSKIVNMIFSAAFLTIFAASLKYGIELLIVKKTADIGLRVILISIVFFLVGIFIGIFFFQKNVRERNARNFLLLVFNCIEEKRMKGEIETSNVLENPEDSKIFIHKKDFDFMQQTLKFLSNAYLSGNIIQIEEHKVSNSRKNTKNFENK